MKKVITIVGARPNFIKAALLSEELKRVNLKEVLVHTGQHYDFELSENLFKNLKLKQPDINLYIRAKTHGEQTGKMLIEIEKVLIQEKPHYVVVFGDTNSALAGALAAAKLKIPLTHIEAGERTFIDDMPEEINRKVCDHLSDLNCCATKLAVTFLKKESVRGKILFTGDLMLDIFLKTKKYSVAPNIDLPQNFILLTIHRAENTSDKERMQNLIKVLSRLGHNFVWPIHPRSKKALKKFKINIPKNIKAIDPISYSEMIWLEGKSDCILTDSGGVQKEAYWSHKPCINLLNKTAWQVTLKGGWNQVVSEFGDIKELIKNRPTGRTKISEFGDGHAAQKIADEIIKMI